MSDVKAEMEARVQKLQTFFQERTNFLTQVEENIKQLKAERVNVHKQLNEVRGMLQAYSDVVAYVTPPSAPLNGTPVEAMIPVVEGEVVNS